MNTDFTQKVEFFKGELKKRLGQKRYFHSLCVADEARELAGLYGYPDPDKAYMAGLLHDITKDADEATQLALLKKYGQTGDPLVMSQRKLRHAKTAPLVLRHEYQVTDEELLSAIEYHTTGRAKMKPLERLLFLADFTSADRDYRGADEMRAAVRTNPDKAMRIALAFTVQELACEQKPIHPDTIEAYNEIMMKE